MKTVKKYVDALNQYLAVVENGAMFSDGGVYVADDLRKPLADLWDDGKGFLDAYGLLVIRSVVLEMLDLENLGAARRDAKQSSRLAWLRRKASAFCQGFYRDLEKLAVYKASLTHTHTFFRYEGAGGKDGGK